MVNADAFVCSESQCYLSLDRGAGMERVGLTMWGLTPPRRGRCPQEILGLSLRDSLISLEFFHLNLCSFLTNEIIYIIFKRSLEEALLSSGRRRVSNSFTSSSKTIVQTCKATRSCRGIQEVREF